jgi:hypothetical protein
MATACVVAMALGTTSAARAQSCSTKPVVQSVSLLLLDSARKVDEFAAVPRDTKMIVREPGIAIFEDGRVVASDANAATRHLNALGWAGKPLQVVASFPVRPKPPPGGG